MRHSHNPLMGVLVIILAFVLAPWTSADAQDRMPPIPPDQMTETEKETVAKVMAPEGNLPAYLVPLLRSPEVMIRTKALGDYVVRSRTALSPKLTELVILVVVRHWTQQYMWNSHYRAALREGLHPDIADAIGQGRRPVGLKDDEETLYDFCTELQQNRSVSEPTYARHSASRGSSTRLGSLVITRCWQWSTTRHACRLQKAPLSLLRFPADAAPAATSRDVNAVRAHSSA